MKILSLTGGGTSGYMTCKILDRVESELDIQISSSVDLIAGTSTGALIGAALSCGFGASFLAGLYKDMYDDVFGSPRWFIKSLFTTRYKNNGLVGIAKEIYGDKKIGDEDLSCHLMVAALRLNQPELRPKFWKSWDTRDKNALIREIVVASSAIPGVFSPYKIEDQYYFDGGLCVNNPTVCAIADAISTPELGLRTLRDITACTINTDFHKGFEKPSKFSGLLSVLPHLTEFCIDGSERVTDYIAKALLNDHHTNILPDIYLPADSNDWKQMDKAVNDVWDRDHKRILQFFID